MNANEIISKLGLVPHPEGGYFRETFRDDRQVDGRSVGTAIFYMLRKGEISHWHRVDAAEIWHYYAGAPLKLRISKDEGATQSLVLGPNLDAGQLPQHVVPADWWQSARSMGDWTLVGCTVSPGFEFSGFEMAEDGWEPT